MHPNDQQDSDTDTLAAIERVLSAERGSEVVLEECRNAATATITAAADRAAIITARTRQRIAKLHERCAHTLAIAIQQLEHSSADAPGAAHCGDALSQRLAEHVARNLLRSDHDALSR
jgi:hypothetical protein